MGAQPGKRRAHRHTALRRPTKRLWAGVALLLGAALAGWAWIYLVGSAIAFGTLGRAGQGGAWLFTFAATVGAIVCLLLVFTLLARAGVAFGLVSEYTPRRAAGRRSK